MEAVDFDILEGTDAKKKARYNEWQSNKLTIYATTKYLPSEYS